MISMASTAVSAIEPVLAIGNASSSSLSDWRWTDGG
jgi:hypothetical protein